MVYKRYARSDGGLGETGGVWCVKGESVWNSIDDDFRRYGADEFDDRRLYPRLGVPVALAGPGDRKRK